MLTNLLIVAKTRRGNGACIGGITQNGASVRLVALDADQNEGVGLEYEVGEVWEVNAERASELIPPHVENIIVHAKRRLAAAGEITPFLLPFIEKQMPPKVGGVELLYEGLTQTTATGALYITKRTRLPPYSTHFWRPDQTLVRDDEGKRIRYRYPTKDGGRTLTFVGFQEPLPVIPAGTLLRISLAHWWRPEEEPVQEEYRCYVQLSGWFLEASVAESRPLHRGQVQPAEHTPAAPASPHSVLRRVFGFDDFRPPQEGIITNILQRQDTLVIMPTGGGKSLCYQLPALLMDGMTVVVSPLIALMQDQVDQLRQLGIAAAFLNSSLHYSDYVATAQRVKQGAVRLLYLAPETLLRPETLLLLDQAKVTCLAIDEAHCISQWGHDFRPEYRQLVTVRRRFPAAVCVALTATATPRVQADIRQALAFRVENSFVTSFDRRNLFISVIPKQGTQQQVLDFLAAHPNQSGILYCATQRQVDLLSANLQANGVACLPYHAGLGDDVRRRNQTAFLRDDAPIMVATIAFGMGINKPDVRFVLHVNLPQDMESYYQQIGRAGRDGLRADCLLLYSYSDVHTIRHFIRQGAASEQADRTERLETLVQWAGSDECRRRQILAYFGETTTAEKCGMCDNCLRDPAECIDLTRFAQMFLSCVVRTEQRFGADHIIQVLRGSRARPVRTHGHDRLSTYGVGAELSANEWHHLAHQFLQQRLVEKESFGNLKVTQAGRAVLRGAQVRGTLTTASFTGGEAEAVTYDPDLFARLRTTRKELADAEQTPPYVIFADRTLQEMATYYPHTRSTLLVLFGVGDVKCNLYGDTFLAVIRRYCEEHGLAERSNAARVETPRSSTVRPATVRSIGVGEAFVGGQSISELMAALGVKRQTIIQHLEAYLQTGRQLSTSRLRAESGLAQAQQERVLAAFAELGSARLRPVYLSLQEKIPYDTLHLLRMVYVLEQAITAAPQR
jgi:ATP-dependent DNA helicase RecQ